MSNYNRYYLSMFTAQLRAFSSPRYRGGSCAICTGPSSYYTKEGPLFVPKEPTCQIAWLRP